MKTLSIKSFEKARKLHDSIVLIDSEILAIEKLANEIASDSCSVKFSMQVENHSKVEKKPYNDDPDKMPTHLGFFDTMQWIHQFTVANKAVDHRHELTDTESLHILGALLRVKYERRTALINEINRMGVEL